MSVIQNSANIYLVDGPPNSVILTVRVAGIDRGKAEELKDRLKEVAGSLATEVLGDNAKFSIEGRVV